MIGEKAVDLITAASASGVGNPGRISDIWASNGQNTVLSALGSRQLKRVYHHYFITLP